MWGNILVNISVLGLSLSQLLAKIIYIRHNITPLEFIATRESVACCIWILTVNIQLKHYMWDRIKSN